MDTCNPYSTVELADGVDRLSHHALGIGRILSDMSMRRDDLNDDVRMALEFLGFELTRLARRVMEIDGSEAELV